MFENQDHSYPDEVWRWAIWLLSVRGSCCLFFILLKIQSKGIRYIGIRNYECIFEFIFWTTAWEGFRILYEINPLVRCSLGNDWYIRLVRFRQMIYFVHLLHAPRSLEALTLPCWPWREDHEERLDTLLSGKRFLCWYHSNYQTVSWLSSLMCPYQCSLKLISMTTWEYQNTIQWSYFNTFILSYNCNFAHLCLHNVANESGFQPHPEYIHAFPFCATRSWR